MQGWTLFRNQRRPCLYFHRLLKNLLCPGRGGWNRGRVVSRTPSLAPHFATNRTLSREIVIPSQLNVTDPASWLEPVERLLPSELRRQPPKHDLPQTSPPAPPHPTTNLLISSITYTIQQARNQSNLDLLVHLGLHEGRWDAMLWISQLLIETSKPPQTQIYLLGGVSTIDWPADQTLHEITVRPFIYANRDQHPLANGVPLAKITSSDRSIHAEFPDTKSGQIVGELWQSLARLVLEAGIRSTDESQAIMTNVVRVLAYLHRHHFIPEAIARFNPNSDPSAIQQPSHFYEISAQMLMTLRDVEDDIRFGGVFQDLARPDISKSSRHSAGIRFGPHHWLEFILWCCVHGQWLLQGASIVAEMRKMTGAPWSLFSWRNEVQPTGKIPGAFSKLWSRIKRAWSLPNPDPSRPIAERTISAEVVVALIDGLMAASTTSGGLEKHSMTILDKISALKKVLDRDRMSLGISTWDALISRFADFPGLVSPERNPRMTETALELAETYGKEINSMNGPGNAAPGGLSSRFNYVFDGSAAVIGLYHRTLLTYIRSRDSNGALRLLGRLQSLTDANKKKSLTQFFSKLRSTAASATGQNFIKVDGRDKWHDTIDTEALFPKMQFPSCFPEIPVAILAELLDLVIESGNPDVGTWMVHSKDVDGPLIPESLYGNQIIAPALIRFAAETNDGLLLSKLTRSQTVTVSGQTLVALCDHRIRSGRFTAAEEIIGVMKKYSIHEWTIFDLTNLLRGLLLQIYGENASKDLDEPTSKHAAALLQRLLRGDFGQVWGTSISQLETVVCILSSLDPHLSNLCLNIASRKKTYRIDLPTSCFNSLLEGSTRIWGSAIGKELYDDWCSDKMHRHIPDLAGFEEPYQMESTINVPELFSVPDSDLSMTSEPYENEILFLGKIEPGVDTIRVIIQVALEEARKFTPKESSALSPDESAPCDKVLQWAADVLKAQFLLSDNDIDYELQGHHLSNEAPLPDQQPYSSQTMQIWKALSGPRRAWALAKESELRAFASSKSESQIVFDAAPPAERLLLHCIAIDYGLVSETFGESYERNIKVSKINKTEPRVPEETIDDILQLGY